MKEMILRVVKCGECFTVKSEKSEGGVLNKRTLVLQELGGKYENSYVVSALGNLASIQFSEGDLVIATLRFQSREYNGQMFMDVIATELIHHRATECPHDMATSFPKTRNLRAMSLMT